VVPPPAQPTAWLSPGLRRRHSPGSRLVHALVMPSLAADDLLLARDLVASGRDDRELARACASGTLVRVWPGAYVQAGRWHTLDPREQHRCRAIAALATRRKDGLLLSHESAALVWGLPTWGWPSGPVELVDPTATRGTSTARLRVRASPLPLEERATRSGVPVTSFDRTVTDLLLSRSRGQAVVLADHLLYSGLSTRDHLIALLAVRPAAGRRRAAAWAVDFGDPGGESPGESVSRVVAHDAGLVAPELQVPFSDGDGLIGVVDFAFPVQDEPDRLVLGEFDGDVKYRGATYRHGRTPEQVVQDEKSREDRLRALTSTAGFVRWTRRDLADASRLADKLRRAGVARKR
jgi:hypothetical protein